MKKKVLAVLLGGCMVVGMLAGCGSKGGETKTTDEGNKTEGSGDSKGYHFEVVVKSFQSSYWQAAVQGINQACDELGVTANTTGPNAESDIADQVNMLNNAINKDPDGIALAACDQNSVIDSLKSALEKKIPVVCFDSGVPDAPEGSVYATVVTDNEQAGGIAMIKAMAAPYQNLKFMPTGGINAGNLKDYLSCDKILCCGGSWMVKGDMIRNGEIDQIQVMVKEAKELADEIRFN